MMNCFTRRNAAEHVRQSAHPFSELMDGGQCARRINTSREQRVSRRIRQARPMLPVLSADSVLDRVPVGHVLGATLANEQRLVRPEHQLRFKVVVGLAPQTDIGRGRRASHRVRLDVVAFQKSRLRAAPAIRADRGAASAVARPHRAPDGRRNVARTPPIVAALAAAQSRGPAEEPPLMR